MFNCVQLARADTPLFTAAYFAILWPYTYVCGLLHYLANRLTTDTEYVHTAKK